jgi:hypothetical protein
MALMESLLGLGIGLVVLLLVSIIANFVFWLWMLVDALRKRDTLWIALLIFSFFTGFLSGLMATVYWFVVYRKR